MARRAGRGPPRRIGSEGRATPGPGPGTPPGRRRSDRCSTASVPIRIRVAGDRWSVLCSAGRRDCGDGLARQRLQLLTRPGDPELAAAASAVDPHSRHTPGRVGPAARADQAAPVVLVHRCAAHLALRDGPAGPTGQQSGSTGAVQDAHDPAAATGDVTHRVDQPARVQPAAAAVLAAPVDHRQRRPAAAAGPAGDPLRRCGQLDRRRRRRARSRPAPRARRRRRGRCAARASSDGHGDTSRQGTPARRARSTATSRACQVGEDSLWSISSCSSITTIAASSGAGANTAARPPTTVARQPAAAASHGASAPTAAPGATQSPGEAVGHVALRHDHDRLTHGDAAASGDLERIGRRRRPPPRAPRRRASSAAAPTGSVRDRRRPPHPRPAESRATTRSGEARRSIGGQPTGPPPGRPAAQVHHLRRRSLPDHLGQLGESCTAGSGVDVDRRPPSRRHVDPTAARAPWSRRAPGPRGASGTR